MPAFRPQRQWHPNYPPTPGHGPIGRAAATPKRGQGPRPAVTATLSIQHLHPTRRPIFGAMYLQYSTLLYSYKYLVSSPITMILARNLFGLRLLLAPFVLAIGASSIFWIALFIRSIMVSIHITSAVDRDLAYEHYWKWWTLSVVVSIIPFPMPCHARFRTSSVAYLAWPRSCLQSVPRIPECAQVTSLRTSHR